MNVEDVRDRIGARRTSLHPLSLVAEGLGFVGMGAAVMYVLDPANGARRRGMRRDKLVSLLSEVGDCIDCTFRDMYNRATGVAAEARYLFGGGGAPDDVLVQRVRARMGRVVSHPKAVLVV